MLPGNLVFVHPSIDTLTDLTTMIVGGVMNYKHLHPKSYLFSKNRRDPDKLASEEAS